MGGTMRLGCVALQARARLLRAQGLRQTGDQRAAPPPLRISTATTKGAGRRSLRITGRTPDENYVESVEAQDHPWFLAANFTRIQSKPLNRTRCSRRSLARRWNIRRIKARPVPGPTRAAGRGLTPHVTA